MHERKIQGRRFFTLMGVLALVAVVLTSCGNGTPQLSPSLSATSKPQNITPPTSLGNSPASSLAPRPSGVETLELAASKSSIDWPSIVQSYRGSGVPPTFTPQIIQVLYFTTANSGYDAVVNWTYPVGAGDGSGENVAVFSIANGTQPSLVSFLVASDVSVPRGIRALMVPFQIPHTNTDLLEPSLTIANRDLELSSDLIDVCAKAATGPRVALALQPVQLYLMRFGWRKGGPTLVSYTRLSEASQLGNQACP